MAAFKMKLDDFEHQHGRIADAIKSARDSMSESGCYKIKLAKVRDAYRKMGELLDAAESSMTGDEPLTPRGAESKPQGADSAPTRAEIPHIARIMNQTL
jgi:hypothetical protein